MNNSTATTPIPYTGRDRTRLQWFNSLPADIKHKAIINYERTGRKNFDHPFRTLSDCLHGSFIFTQTPEQYAFWKEVIETYEPRKGHQ